MSDINDIIRKTIKGSGELSEGLSQIFNGLSECPGLVKALNKIDLNKEESMKSKENNKEDQERNDIDSMLVCLGIMKRSKEDYKDVNVIGSFAIRKESYSDRDIEIVKDPKDQYDEIHILPPSSFSTCVKVNSFRRFVLTIPGFYGVIFSCKLFYIVKKFHVDATLEFPGKNQPVEMCRLDEMDVNSQRTRLIFNENLDGDDCYQHEVR